MKLSALAAGVALALPAAASAQVPQLPNGPDLGKPDDTATFRVELVGTQTSELIVNGNGWTHANPNCSFSWTTKTNETWKLERGKGAVFRFERYGRIVFLKRMRGGHASYDTSFTAVGDVFRTASGRFEEVGPPGCRGTTEVGQEDCGKHFSVRSPLALLWTGKGLKLERSPSAELLKNPAERCGTDPIGSYSLDNPYPMLIGGKLGPLKRDQIFGRRHRLHVSAYRHGLSSALPADGIVPHSLSTMAVGMDLVRER
jgi:hypothetical protein